MEDDSQAKYLSISTGEIPQSILPEQKLKTLYISRTNLSPYTPFSKLFFPFPAIRQYLLLMHPLSFCLSYPFNIHFPFFLHIFPFLSSLFSIFYPQRKYADIFLWGEGAIFLYIPVHSLQKLLVDLFVPDLFYADLGIEETISVRIQNWIHPNPVGYYGTYGTSTVEY